MMNAMRSFASAARFPKSVCNALIDGLDSRLVPIFRRNYPDHAVLHDLSASYQRGKFQDILRAMQMAEDEVNSISEIACSTVNGQAFHADALVHASQAERTLSRYHGGDGYTSEEGTSDIRRISFGWWTFCHIERLPSWTPRSLLWLQWTPPVDC
jgi:hypothetical protein